MKIFTDFTSFNINRKDGLNRYIDSFLYSLSKKDYNKIFEVFSGSNHKVEKELNFIKSKNIFMLPNFKAVFSRYLFQNFILPVKKYDIYYSPIPEAPMFGGRIDKRVITVHDILPIRYENTFPKAKYHYKIYLKKLLNRVDRVIAVSNFTKRELLNYYNCNENKIDVVYQGYNKEFFYKREVSDFNKLKEKYSLENGYILAVGETREYKNFDIIIEALKRIKNSDIKLVVVGKINRLDNKTISKIKNLGLENRVVLTDYISDDDLAVLYSFTELFIFPSKYEGFGIPVLEALGCGANILLSDIPPFHEIMGENENLFFDPYNIEDLVEKIDYALDKGIIIDIDKVEYILQKFDWDKTVDKIYGVLNSIK